MKHLTLSLFAATALAFSAASHAAEPAAAAPAKPVKDYLIAEVNGEKIQYHDVEKIWDELFPGEGKAPALANFGDAIRDNVVRGIVSEKLMVAEANRQKLGDSKEVQDKLTQMKNQLMVQELLKRRNASLSEANIKAKYDEMTKKVAGKEEVHARHILVEKEADAQKLYKEIKAGGDFAKLAKEKSADKGSAANGGDLGYFTKDQMVPEFAEAAFALKKGALSEPVKSAFGWHIIKLEDRRAVPVPKLEEVRAQISQQLQAEANQQYITDLLKNAKLKYYSPEGKEVPFPAEQKPAEKK